MNRFKFLVKIFILCSFYLLSSCSLKEQNIATHKKSVNLPEIYQILQNHISYFPVQTDNHNCESIQPFTDKLVFRSRYEGSDRARDKVNTKAEESYKNSTRQFTQLQRTLAKQTDSIVNGKADNNTLNCIMQNLQLWANKSSLLQETKNHTGKAVRKWTLAAISSNLLKIKNITEKHQKKRFNEVKSWIEKLAYQVVKDYSGDPLKKTNNHHYWASWAVMTSAALLDDPTLYDWSKDMYITAMNQIDEDGFLANELRRKSRAAMYHNYALTPLVGVATFLHANNTDPFKYNDMALDRLTEKVLLSLVSAEDFERKTGVKQIKYDLKQHGRLAWIVLFPQIATKAQSENTKKCLLTAQSGISLKSSRLGGDLKLLSKKHY